MSKNTKPAAAAAGSSDPHNGQPAPNDVECYYDQARKSYWTKNGKGEWHELTQSNLRLHLRSHGYHITRFFVNGLNWNEQKILDITHEFGVHYAGAVAGYQQGVHEIAGQRVLVTRGPKLIEPKRGKSPLLRDLFKQLLGSQWPYFYGWLKAARAAMLAGPPWRPGQLLAVAGPPGSGKSLVQNLITEILGGRAAKPYRYMTERTNFNGDLIGAENLVIEDEVSSKDHRTRQAFGASIKSFCVNRTQSAHKKTLDASTLTPFWRLSITLNDEPESLLVLPPITSDLADKIILLRASPATMPYDAHDQAGYYAYWRNLLAELPAFLYALDRWPIPPDLECVRYGVKGWMNPELLTALNSLAPEMKLWEYISTAAHLWDLGNETWEGTAAELKAMLVKSHPPGDIERLLSFPTAAGVFLGRLAAAMPESVKIWGKVGGFVRYQLRRVE